MRFALLAAAAALAACSKSPEPAATDAAGAPTPPGEASLHADAAAADSANEFSAAADILERVATVDSNAPAADGSERFYGREKFTIVAKQTGVEAGDVVEHVRDYGRRRVEIKKTVMNYGGTSHAADTRMVFEGANVVSIDNSTGAITTVANPLYDTIVARMKGRSGAEFGRAMMMEMGGRATGEKGQFAGESCEYWELLSVGARMCVAEWGGVLHTVANMGGISFERTAAEVRMDDGGPDSAFAYDKSKAAAAPGVEELMSKIGNRPN